jgi:hypothetical protein
VLIVWSVPFRPISSSSAISICFFPEFNKSSFYRFLLSRPRVALVWWKFWGDPRWLWSLKSVLDRSFTRFAWCIFLYRGFWGYWRLQPWIKLWPLLL